jgi:hypothetical protein
MAMAALARKLDRLEGLIRDQDRQGQAALEQITDSSSAKEADLIGGGEVRYA